MNSEAYTSPNDLCEDIWSAFQRAFGAIFALKHPQMPFLGHNLRALEPEAPRPAPSAWRGSLRSRG